MSNQTASEPTIQQLFDMTGKTCMVTGAGGYLGGSMARGLAEAGGRVIITDIDAARAEEVAASLPGSNGSGPNGIEHFGIALNHMDTDEAQRIFADTIERAGGLDVLVNNGHEHTPHDWTDITAGQFTRQMANATGYFILARMLRAHAVENNKPASIIMLGSMYGMVASYPECYEGACAANPAAYQALKGGVLQLTRHLAVYWATDGVRVNAVSPGPYPPPTAPAEMMKRLCAKSPMRRVGRPHELKAAVLFLASDASSYVTGHNLVVDGGWTAQ